MRLLLTICLFPLLILSCNSGGGSKAGSGSSDNTNTTSNFGNTTVTNTPNGVDDPLATYAWHLENTGQMTFSTGAGTAGQDFNIKEAHDAGYKGTGIKIAISDSGTEISHPDLSANTLSGLHRNYSSSSPSMWRNANPFAPGIEGHGTSVAGLAAAVGWNGIGSRGVAPSAGFGAFYFIGDFSDTDASLEAKTTDQMTGTFDIYNYSYGYPGCYFLPAYTSVTPAYKSGVTSLRSGKGAIYVKAAGNDYIGYNSDCDPSDNSYFFGNTNTDEEQNNPYIILTAAVNARGRIASYSTPGSGVWVASAGGEFGDDAPAMLTTDLTTCTEGYSTSDADVTGFNSGQTLNPDCNYTSVMNGTSSATPVLSGIVALMLQAKSTLTWRDIKHILATTAEKVNYSTAAITHPAGASGALAGHVYDYLYVVNNAGYSFSNTYGFGRVNAQSAVNTAKTFTSLGTYLESGWSTSGTISMNIPDKSSTGVSSSISVSSNYIIESIQIKLTTDHTFIGDLGIQLTSPNGTVSRILPVNSMINHSGLSDFMMLTNAFYGERSAGSWTIKIVDGATSDTGKLTNWKIKVNGRAN